MRRGSSATIDGDPLNESEWDESELVDDLACWRVRGSNCCRLPLPTPDFCLFPISSSVSLYKYQIATTMKQ